MTIASSTRKAGPFAGDGASMIFAFSFKVFSASDLYVVKAATATGAETVLTLTTDYTVSLNADQNNSPGGTVTLTSVLASGYTLTLTSSVGYLQPTDLTNQGGFYPQVITTALDRLTILAQQLKEKVDRAVVVPISSALTVDALTADLITLADDVANIDIVAGSIAGVNTVAGSIVNVNTVADNVADVTNFADVYYGPSATNPTTRKDGSALQEGDLYFDTATNLMRVQTAVSGWLDAQTPVPISITTQTFSGTGSQVDFTLSSAPAFLNALEVYIAGATLVPGADYFLSGAGLTFASAPASGTNNIFCRWISAYEGGVPNDGSVTTIKIADSAVTGTQIADGAVTNTKIANGTIWGNEKIADASISGVKITDASIWGDNKIINGSIWGDAKIADGSISWRKIDAAEWNYGSHFQQIPTGTMILFGTAVGSTNNDQVTFPIAFTTTPYVIFSLSNGSTDNTPSVVAGSITATGFRWTKLGGNNGGVINWVAFGNYK